MVIKIKTGIGLIMLSLGYMMTVFIVFSYIPSSSFQVSGGSLPALNTSINATGTYEDPANVGILALAKGMFSFGITGAAVPAWLSLLGAYLPVVMILLGVYAILRGI